MPHVSAEKYMARPSRRHEMALRWRRIPGEMPRKRAISLSAGRVPVGQVPSLVRMGSR